MICFKCYKVNHKSSNYINALTSNDVKERIKVVIMKRIEERNDYERNLN